MAWSSIWQLYHSLPCYTWFEPIFTPLWSSFLCWQSLKKSYQQTHHNFNSKRWLEVLLDNFTILTPFFTHVYWMNEALTQGFGSIACSEQKRSAAYLGALPAKESICVTQPFQPENCPNWHLTKICGLHSSEAIAALVSCIADKWW